MADLMHHKSSSAVTESHEHHSAVPYILVWIALIIFTIVTYVTGRMHLGTWALPLALAIAVTKSTLVLLFFMHLWEEKGANRLIVGLSVVFVLTLLVFVFLDIGWRFQPATPSGAPFGKPLVMPGAGTGEHELRHGSNIGGLRTVPPPSAPSGGPHDPSMAPQPVPGGHQPTTPALPEKHDNKH